jgi:hypothetical protein
VCRTEPQPEAAAADKTIVEQALCRCSSLPGEQRCPILLPWFWLRSVILTISSLLVPNQSSVVPPSAVQPWHRSSKETISGFVLVHHPTLKIYIQGIIAPKNIK